MRLSILIIASKDQFHPTCYGTSEVGIGLLKILYLRPLPLPVKIIATLIFRGSLSLKMLVKTMGSFAIRTPTFI